MVLNRHIHTMRRNRLWRPAVDVSPSRAGGGLVSGVNQRPPLLGALQPPALHPQRAQRSQPPNTDSSSWPHSKDCSFLVDPNFATSNAEFPVVLRWRAHFGEWPPYFCGVIPLGFSISLHGLASHVGFTASHLDVVGLPRPCLGWGLYPTGCSSRLYICKPSNQWTHKHGNVLLFEYHRMCWVYKASVIAQKPFFEEETIFNPALPSLPVRAATAWKARAWRGSVVGQSFQSMASWIRNVYRFCSGWVGFLYFWQTHFVQSEKSARTGGARGVIIRMA